MQMSCLCQLRLVLLIGKSQIQRDIFRRRRGNPGLSNAVVNSEAAELQKEKDFAGNEHLENTLKASASIKELDPTK